MQCSLRRSAAPHHQKRPHERAQALSAPAIGQGMNSILPLVSILLPSVRILFRMQTRAFFFRRPSMCAPPSPDSRRVPQSSYAPFPSVCPQAFLNAFDFREQPLHHTEPLRVQQSLSLPQDRRAGSLRVRHSNHHAKALLFRQSFRLHFHDMPPRIFRSRCIFPHQ